MDEMHTNITTDVRSVDSRKGRKKKKKKVRQEVPATENVSETETVWL